MTSDISGTRSLHRLVYASKIKIRDADLEYQVGQIIQASIRNNRGVSLTGLLLVHGGWFLQALEGPAGEVMTTYQRILNDPRHEEPRTLAAGPASVREFGGWNMCAARISPADDAILETLAQRQTFDPLTRSATAALRLLKTVRSIQQRRQVGAAA